MKIAMFYELFWPAKGGIEAWIASISRELVKRGHQVDVITGSEMAHDPQSQEWCTTRAEPGVYLMANYFPKGKGTPDCGRQLWNREISWHFSDLTSQFLTGHL
jgi:hypothetical protein